MAAVILTPNYDSVNQSLPFMHVQLKLVLLCIKTQTSLGFSIVIGFHHSIFLRVAEIMKTGL